MRLLFLGADGHMRGDQVGQYLRVVNGRGDALQFVGHSRRQLDDPDGTGR